MRLEEFDEVYANRRLISEVYSLNHFMNIGVNCGRFKGAKGFGLIHKVAIMKATIKLLEDNFKIGIQAFG